MVLSWTAFSNADAFVLENFANRHRSTSPPKAAAESINKCRPVQIPAAELLTGRKAGKVKRIRCVRVPHSCRLRSGQTWKRRPRHSTCVICSRKHEKTLTCGPVTKETREHVIWSRSPLRFTVFQDRPIHYSDNFFFFIIFSIRYQNVTRTTILVSVRRRSSRTLHTHATQYYNYINNTWRTLTHDNYYFLPRFPRFEGLIISATSKPLLLPTERTLVMYYFMRGGGSWRMDLVRSCPNRITVHGLNSNNYTPYAFLRHDLFRRYVVGIYDLFIASKSNDVGNR